MPRSNGNIWLSFTEVFRTGIENVLYAHGVNDGVEWGLAESSAKVGMHRIMLVVFNDLERISDDVSVNLLH